MANRKENPLDVEYMSRGIFNAKSNSCASLIHDIFDNGIIVYQLSSISGGLNQQYINFYKDHRIQTKTKLTPFEKQNQFRYAQTMLGLRRKDLYRYRACHPRFEHLYLRTFFRLIISELEMRTKLCLVSCSSSSYNLCLRMYSFFAD